MSGVSSPKSNVNKHFNGGSGSPKSNNATSGGTGADKIFTPHGTTTNELFYEIEK